jgi:DNA-binding transcriptional LysR family regulator
LLLGPSFVPLEGYGFLPMQRIAIFLQLAQADRHLERGHHEGGTRQMGDERGRSVDGPTHCLALCGLAGSGWPSGQAAAWMAHTAVQLRRAASQTTEEMLRRLDPYSLQLFVTAADEGSIARAAAKEHIAPSALSRRIADLEHAFGLPLFVRSAHGIALTDAGRVAYERARQFESGLESLMRDVQCLNGVVAGRVRLFANASSVIGFLPERLKTFSADFPRVSIELQERLSGDVVRACLDDIADVGVCVVDAVPSGLDAWHFADDPMMVVLPRGHALGDAGVLDFRKVAQHPLVCIQTGGALDRTLRDRAAAARLELDIAVTVNSFDAVCRMVEAGLGIAIVPTSAAAAYAGTAQFDRRPLGEPWAGRELHVVALHKSPRSAGVEALIGALKR